MLPRRYRALDLTDVKGSFCGKMLAELGVEVIKVEPPQGSSERKLAPFYHDEPHLEKSLYWFAFNAGKRGITLNLDSADGRNLFRRLAVGADFVIESFCPGHLGSLGLGYRALCEVNPRLILTSITPFGQTGPRSHFAASDLTILALGGLLNLDGDADRAPIRFAVEQTFPQAGAQAAAATMIAHRYRQRSGVGQHVDVSMQEAICETLSITQHMWDIQRAVERRQGVFLRRGRVNVRLIFPCRDGFVAWHVFVARMGSKTTALVEWMAECEMAGELIDVDFSAVDMNDLPQKELTRWENVFAAFFLTKTKAELQTESAKRGIMLFPVNDARDLLHDPQLAARDFWTDVEHPQLGTTLRYPGHPYHTTCRDLPQIRRAPLLGEHNEDIYCRELALTAQGLSALKQAGVV